VGHTPSKRVGHTLRRLMGLPGLAQSLTGSGCLLSLNVGPRTIQRNEALEITLPMTSVGMTPKMVLKIPPRNEPTGIVPQTIVLIVAFILP